MRIQYILYTYTVCWYAYGIREQHIANRAWQLQSVRSGKVVRLPRNYYQARINETSSRDLIVLHIPEE